MAHEEGAETPRVEKGLWVGQGGWAAAEGAMPVLVAAVAKEEAVED